jgi:hypothetical protein
MPAVRAQQRRDANLVKPYRQYEKFFQHESIPGKRPEDDRSSPYIKAWYRFCNNDVFVGIG